MTTIHNSQQTNRRNLLRQFTFGALAAPLALQLQDQQAVALEAVSISPPSSGKTGDGRRTFGKISSSGTLLESQRELPVAGESDVLVCGAGPAGIAAAIAAARAGARTQLLEFAGCLGGVWTAGLLTKILDAGNKTGIMKEILDEMVARGADPAKVSRGTTYEPELLKLVLEEMCVEAGVKIQLHTQVVGAITDDNRKLVAVITESKSGRQAWLAERFIDCSGDGDLAAAAGCEFDVGLGQDCVCQPMSLIALLTGLDADLVAEYNREVGIQAKPNLLKLLTTTGLDPSYRSPTLRHLSGDLFSLMTNHEYGVSALDAGQITEATIRARAEVHRIVNHLRQLGGPWSNIAIVATAEQIGVREGRRIKGRYSVTADDLVKGLRHPDAVCRSTFPMDVHETTLNDAMPEVVKDYRRLGVKPYDIPLAALIAADIDNLMMAGRCISGDFIAHSSYRVTGNSVPMGEAAGLTCAVSLKKGLMPHELSWRDVQAGAAQAAR
ncbi:FAD-dependent oxidoreductase [Planctomicrobium sp. SH664]|uniref:FAD-dependent oxidoreductase n=1 Tax=Planctomicrobium sp. SH664 TaxID=3448125 RepID=UPI003F5B6B02